MATAKQKAAQARFKAAAKQAKREGKKGKAYTKRVGQLLKGTGSGSTKKKAKKSKSKTNRKPKSKYYPRKTGGNKMANNGNKNKFTPSNIAKMWALSGSAIHRASNYARTGDVDQFKAGIPKDYAGYDYRDGSFNLGRMTKGYAGALNDLGYRKFAKALGFRAYPTGKPKTMSQYLDYLTMYGDTVIQGIANKDDTHEAHRAMYEGQYGVDLGSEGFAAWQPFEMARTKLPYTAKKIVFKLLRQAGYSV